MIKKSNIILFCLHLLGNGLTLYGVQTDLDSLVEGEQIGSRQVYVIKPPVVARQENNTCGPAAADALLKVRLFLMGTCSAERVKRKLEISPRSLPTDGRGMDGTQLDKHLKGVYGRTHAQKLSILDIPVNQLLNQWDPITFQTMNQARRNRFASELYHLRSRNQQTPWDNNPILWLIQVAQESGARMSHYIGVAHTENQQVLWIDTYDEAADQKEVATTHCTGLTANEVERLNKQIAKERTNAKQKEVQTRRQTIECLQQLIQNPDDLYSLYPLLVPSPLHTLVTETQPTGNEKEDLKMLQLILTQLETMQIHWIENFNTTPIYKRIQYLFTAYNLGDLPGPERLNEIHTSIKAVQTMDEARKALQVVQLVHPISDDSSPASSVGSSDESAGSLVPAFRQSGPYTPQKEESPRSWWQRLYDWIRGKQAAPSTVEGRIKQRKQQQKEEKKRPHVAFFTGFLAATLKVLADIFGSSS